jgi:2-polyprenyl-3-methyl-5-hydroxy-6-metoxy-1,4-benzoquinol methylase
MAFDVTDICDVVRQPEGESLLRLMCAVYAGTPVEMLDPLSSGMVSQAKQLGLLNISDKTGPHLTALGYQIGNVAKEYCNWIDHGRRMPPPRPDESFYAGKDVLDLGCSFGRWLWEFKKASQSVQGIEMQKEYITLGEALAAREGISPPPIRHGSAEDVDQYVAPGSVDFVFARLVFNHLAISPTLQKIAAVLRRNGVLWIQSETFGSLLSKLFVLERNRRMRSLGFHALALVNSFLFMSIGTQLQVRASGRMHSSHKPAYPALWSWKRALLQAGFNSIHVEHRSSTGFALWARKP